MYITIRGRDIRIHDAQSGIIRSTKTMPEEVLDAQLTDDIITVTMPGRTHVLKRIGNSYNFTVFRVLPR